MKRTIKVVVTRTSIQRREYEISGEASLTPKQAEDTALLMARWPQDFKEQEVRLAAKAVLAETAPSASMPTCPDCERAVHACHCEP